MRHLAPLADAPQATLMCDARQVRELADMLRSVSERLSAVQTAADGERSRLEHTVQDLEGRLRHLQSTASQLRWAAAARRLPAAAVWLEGLVLPAAWPEPLDECCRPVSTSTTQLRRGAAARMVELARLALHAADPGCWAKTDGLQ